MDFYQLPDICVKLGKSDRWFRRHQSELESIGFPKAIKLHNRGGRYSVMWRKAEVDAFCHGDPRAAMTPSERNAVASRAALDQKYGRDD